MAGAAATQQQTTWRGDCCSVCDVAPPASTCLPSPHCYCPALLFLLPSLHCPHSFPAHTPSQPTLLLPSPWNRTPKGSACCTTSIARKLCPGPPVQPPLPAAALCAADFTLWCLAADQTLQRNNQFMQLRKVGTSASDNKTPQHPQCTALQQSADWLQQCRCPAASRSTKQFAQQTGATEVPKGSRAEPQPYSGDRDC
jgi:hypothetical protein